MEVRCEDSQFNDKPTDERADTAYKACYRKRSSGVYVGKLTCGGDTSEINTNGTGPRPIAKDLANHSK